MMVLMERNGDVVHVHELGPGDDPIDAAVARALLITDVEESRIRSQLRGDRRFTVGGYEIRVKRVRKLKGKRA